MPAAASTQLEYHGVYIALISAGVVIVVGLTIAAIGEARQNRHDRNGGRR